MYICAFLDLLIRHLKSYYHIADVRTYKKCIFPSSHRDLGVNVETNLKFHSHIRETVHKAGGVVSSLLKATVCRTPEFMSNIFVSDIRPILDFCSSLWNLGYVGNMRMIESVQRRWTRQIGGLEELSYEERLKRLNLYSIKGRLLRCDYCMLQDFPQSFGHQTL